MLLERGGVSVPWIELFSLSFPEPESSSKNASAKDKESPGRGYNVNGKRVGAKGKG